MTEKLRAEKKSDQETFYGIDGKFSSWKGTEGKEKTLGVVRVLSITENKHGPSLLFQCCIPILLFIDLFIFLILDAALLQLGDTEQKKKQQRYKNIQQ